MTPMIFKPRPSSGWLWLGGIGFILLAYIVSITTATCSAETVWTVIWPAALVGGISLVFILFAAWFPTMRYILESDRLILRYGPVLRYEIPLSSIKGMRRRDLTLSLVASFRLPGVAIFEVLYGEVGKVKMCASSASKSILLIETEQGLYGVTPQDEQAFVAAVRNSPAIRPSMKVYF
jgi:hypothetical protein